MPWIKFYPDFQWVYGVNVASVTSGGDGEEVFFKKPSSRGNFPVAVLQTSSSI